MTVAVLWIREAQCLICRWETPGVSTEVQRWVCHSPWEPSQAFPALLRWDFSLCLSSGSSKDSSCRRIFMVSVFLEVLLVLPIWGNGECFVLVESRVRACMLSEVYVAEVSGL